MTDAKLRADDRMIDMCFADGSTATYPCVWLRDNDPSGLHPDTKERILDLTQIDLDDVPTEVWCDDETLTILWQSDGARSVFPVDWLAAHRPGVVAADPAIGKANPWRGDIDPAAIHIANAVSVLEDDTALMTWMIQTQVYGMSIVGGLADTVDAGMEVARRIGFLRRTNFGIEFDVQSKPNPNNLAYTSIALPLHTDLPNQEVAPGYQFLHCLANDADGGESQFSDGFAAAEDLRREDPEAFRILSTVSIPFRFHDGDTDLRSRKRVIETDENGTVYEICFNGHLTAPFDMAPDTMAAYYRAFQTFMKMTRSPKYLINLKLGAGEMVVFDNRRVLHGRSAFDVNTGRRHLHGCYVDRGEFESRLRVLSR